MMVLPTIAAAAASCIAGMEAVTKTTTAMNSILDLLDRNKKPGDEVSSEIKTTLKIAQEGVIQAQNSLLAAQKELFTQQQGIEILSQTNATLREELDTIKSFDLEKENFILKPLIEYSFAYIQKDVVYKAGETALYCAPCFDDRKKAMLQFKEHDHNKSALICPKCKNLAFVERNTGPAVMFSGPRERSIW